MKELRMLFCLTSFLFISCNKNETLVILGEDVEQKIYAPSCYIKNGQKVILMKESFLYRGNQLYKYITPQTESMVVFDIKENGITEEIKKYETLYLKKYGKDKVWLFNQIYHIERINKDTIFLNNNTIIINSPRFYY